MTSHWGYWKFAEGEFMPRELEYGEAKSLADVQLEAGIPVEHGSQFGRADHGLAIEVHAVPGKVPARHHYVVGVTIDGCCERVEVDRLPDLIELLGKLAPLVHLGLSTGASPPKESATGFSPQPSCPGGPARPA
jgi:hypothetical protein